MNTSNPQQDPLQTNTARVGGFIVQQGLTPTLVDQLIANSNQAHIRKFTPKDADERFANKDAYEAWQVKGRSIFALVDAEGKLGGIIWYGLEPMPGGNAKTDPNTTFAIRLYEGALGQGLAVPFINESLKQYTEQLKEQGKLADFTGVWLETDADNSAARKTYEKAGYQYKHMGDKRVLMTLA